MTSKTPPVLEQRAVSGAIWNAVEMASSQGITLVVFAIMARFITPADFGIISISYVIVLSIKAVSIDTLIFAIIRQKEASDIEYTTCFWLTLGFATTSALVVFLVAGLAADAFHLPKLKEVMQAMSAILLFSGLARTHEMRLFRLMKFRALALRGIIGALLGGIVGVAFAAAGYGVTALVLQQIATTVISLALVWVSSSWTPSFSVSRIALENIFSMMKTLVPTSLVGVVTNNCDTVLIAYYFGPAYAGYYALAKRLRFALQSIVVAPISGAAFSTLAEVQKESTRLKSAFLKILTLVSFASAPVFVGCSSVAHEVIAIGFGAEWLAAAPIFAVYVTGGLFASLQSFGDVIFTLKNRQVWTFYNSLFFLVLSTAGVVLIGGKHSEYAALPFVLPYIATLLAYLLLLARALELPVSKILSAVYPSMLGSVIMFLAVRLLSASTAGYADALRLIVCSAVGAIVYAAIVFALDRGAIANFVTLLGKGGGRMRQKYATTP